jgi:hypothetical protein
MPDLAPILATPVFFRGWPLDDGLPRRFFFERGRVVRGRVQAVDRSPLVGLQLQPCRIDEVLGRAEPIGPPTTVDSRGQFAIRGLPGRLPPHQCLVLLASGAGRQPEVVFAAAPGASRIRPQAKPSQAPSSRRRSVGAGRAGLR